MNKKALGILSIIAIGAIISSCEKQVIKGDDLYKTVEKYVALGNHRTGTPTDTATSYWLGTELASAGYKVNYLEFPLRQYFLDDAAIVSGTTTIQTFPYWWVNDSIKQDVTATIVDSKAATNVADLKGQIALIRLGNGQSPRQSLHLVDSLSNAGVAAIVAIYENQSGEITAANSTPKPRPWKVPIVFVAPKDSALLQGLIQQKKEVNLYVKGSYKDVVARNVYATIGKGKRYIVVSTPISGWFGCGGERGPGVAIWLGLAQWAASAKSDYTFVFTGNSGHELSGIGAHLFLDKAAPPVDSTELWIHLGAGAATLAYEQTDGELRPLNEVDTLRSLFYSESIKANVDAAFAQSKAQKYNVAQRNGGELVYVADKGYKNILGVSYSHPFFHNQSDDAQSTSPAVLEQTALAYQKLLELTINQPVE